MKSPSLSTCQTIVAQTSPVMITTALRKRPVKENEMTFLRCSVNCFLCIIELNKTYEKRNYGNKKRNINAKHIAKQSKLHEKKIK